MKYLAASLSAFLFTGGSAIAGCAALSDSACEIDGGSYHIALPETSQAPMPVMVFLHGWGSSGANALANGRISPPLLERGYAFIAPNGLPRSSGNGGTWGFHPDW
ncbi:MAG: polyhydroxybutyrate depolymerase, partial [Pseudomonadota bacterium]